MKSIAALIITLYAAGHAFASGNGDDGNIIDTDCLCRGIALEKAQCADWPWWPGPQHTECLCARREKVMFLLHRCGTTGGMKCTPEECEKDQQWIKDLCVGVPLQQGEELKKRGA